MRSLLITASLALSLVATACGDDDDRPARSPTAAPSAAPEATVTSTPMSGATQLTIGDPVPLPEDLALTIETGCWQCDGPTTGFVRIRRTPDGVEERTLLDASSLAGGITGYAFDVQSGRAAISTCAPNCLGLVEPGQQTTVHLSDDLGASFTPGEPLDGWFSIDGFAGASLLISGPVPEPDAPYPVLIYPGLVDAPRPTGAVEPHPVASTVYWTSDRRSTLLAPDGTVLFTSAGDQLIRITSLDGEGERLAALIFRGEGANATYRFLIGRRDGERLEHERTLSDRFIHVGAAIDDCTIVANADIPLEALPTPDTNGAAFTGLVPAVIDVCEAVIHPIIDPFTRAPYLNGRNLIAAVQIGSFLSVADAVGDCLNVRESPSTSAATLGCFGAGVLLSDLGESQAVDGQTWRRVATPAGDEGWASDEFLTP